MNMLLHGVEQPDVRYRDSLAEANTGDAEAYSMVLANPPFAGSLDYENTAKDLQRIVKTKKTELLFVALFLRLLKMGGRAAVIVLDGVLFGSSKAHKELRRMLVEGHKLDAVVKLPSGVFKPYAGVSTAVLFFTKTGSGGTDFVWFYDLQTDGYSLVDKRTPLLGVSKLGPLTELSEDEHEKNNLPDVLERWSLRDATERDRSRTDQSFCVPRDQIAAQGYDLSINRNKEIVHADVEHRSPIEILDELDKVEDEIRAGIAGAPSHAGGVAMSSWPTVLLGELCEVVIGRTPSRAHAEYWGLGRPWLSIADMNPGPGNLDHKGDHHRPGSEGVGIAAYPTKHGPNGFKLSIGKTAVSRIPIYTNEAIAALPIRDSNTLEVGYLIRALAFSDLSLRHNRAAMGATLNKAALLSLPVPLPPVSEQRRIAAILDNADALRTKRRDAGARLDDFATSAFNEAFGDLPLEPLGPRLSFVTSGGRGWAKFYTNNGRPFIRSLDVRMNSISTDGLAHVSPPQNGAPAHRR